MIHTTGVSWPHAYTIRLPFETISVCIPVGATIEPGDGVLLREASPVVQVYGAIDAGAASLSAVGTMAEKLCLIYNEYLRIRKESEPSLQCVQALLCTT